MQTRDLFVGIAAVTVEISLLKVEENSKKRDSDFEDSAIESGASVHNR
jgi:hypothetical protein